MSKSKVHDAEETREETAQRLIAKQVNSLTKANKAAREKFKRHVSRLTPDQRRQLTLFLRRDYEQTIGVLEDAAQDMPEFSFFSEFNLDGPF